MLKVAVNQTEKMQVIKIYNYLYKFSLERLHALLKTKSMVFLILFYLKENSFERIKNSPNMRRYKNAYIEAFHIIIKHNSFKALNLAMDV